MIRGELIALFRGVRYSKGAERPTVPHAPIPHSIEKHDMCLAVPGKIIRIHDHEDPLLRTGTISFGGVLKEVSLAYVPEAKVDDYAIVHVGFALSILDTREAERTLNYLHQIQP